MKLIIQIPCYNEEATLPQTLAELPKSLPRVDVIEWMIIDDGCQDRTREVALENGVHHIISHRRNLGLSASFITGLKAAVRLGADIVVNTDGDNQYCGADIEKLIAPILNDGADMVIGERPIDSIPDFSPAKKLLQKLGSRVVRFASGIQVVDATSGFRAYSRNAAQTLHIFDPFTYTLESILQARTKRLKVEVMPIRVNGKTRESRLFKSNTIYILRSIGTIFRGVSTYYPQHLLSIPGFALILLGCLAFGRFIYFYWLLTVMQNLKSGHTESLILAVASISAGGALIVAGLIANLVVHNRRMLESLENAQTGWLLNQK